MISVSITPREGDRLYEIHVGSAGENFLVSHQGYENAEDAEQIVRRLFTGSRTFTADEMTENPDLVAEVESIDLMVTLRNGLGRHEMIR